MTDKILSWRSSRLHRKCRYCMYLHYVDMPLGCSYYECAAKAKIIRDFWLDMTKAHRLFCRLFEVKEEE